MRKDIVIFLSIMLVFSFVLFKIIVYYLFPYTGLGRILTFPFVGILTIVITIFFYKKMKNEFRLRKILKNFSLSLGLIFVFSFCIEFQDSKNSIPVQLFFSAKMIIYDYKYVSKEDLYLPKNTPNFSRYDCIIRNSQEKYVAALWKFRKNIVFGKYNMYNNGSYYSSGIEIKSLVEKEEDVYNKLQTGIEKVLYKLLSVIYY